MDALSNRNKTVESGKPKTESGRSHTSAFGFPVSALNYGVGSISTQRVATALAVGIRHVWGFSLGANTCEAD